MSVRRDYINEILHKHGRLLKRAGVRQQYEARLLNVVAAYRLLAKLKMKPSVRLEMLKYVPIGYVACIEGYFRLALKTFIDHGEPFVDRVEEIENLKFDCNTVLAITKRRISLGSYVAHIIPLNGVKDISSVFSKILGEDFIKEIQTIDYLFLDGNKRMQLKMPLFSGEDLPALNELFRLRHVFAHELAPKEVVKPRIIGGCISAAAGFSIASEGLFKTKLPSVF